MHSLRDMARRCHLSSWTVCLITFVSLCSCREPQPLRTFQPPQKLSFNIKEITGSAVTYGPNDSGPTSAGKFYRTLTLHNGTLFVGGKSQLFSATENLEIIRQVSIQPNSFFTEFGCKSCDGNFIRIIQPLSGGSLLECGTNALMPYCQERSAVDLTTIGDPYEFSDDNVAPSLPEQNSSWLLLEDSDSAYQIFAGSHLVNSFGQLEEPAILRARLDTMTPGPERPRTGIDVRLKTKDSPNTVLNGPQFVGDPIEYGNRIFFFFREFASEHINSGRIMYSRVSMVCKDELGGQPFTTYTDKQMVTFVKARLVCSIPGKFPYHYNEIQDIHQSTADPNVVFAVFATGPNGVASSAVCAYRLDEIQNMFLESPFKAQEHDLMQWMEVLSEPVRPRQAECPDTTTYSDAEYKAILTLAQLIDDTVENTRRCGKRTSLRGGRFRGACSRISPLLVSHGERFTQIVVDEGVANSTDVLFIGTENGTVLKAYLSEDWSEEARIVEEISLDTDGLKAPVLTMVMSEAARAVFVGTDIGVFKVPFQHCRDYTTCRSCLDARDPYCTWTGDSCSYGSRDGFQDLENGSSDLCPARNNDKIVFHTVPPQSQHRSANQPVNLYLVAEAPSGRNLRVVGVDCYPPCANLPFTRFKSTSSGRQLLVLHINGSSTETSPRDCSCSSVFEIDGGVRGTANFTLTADNSNAVTASEMDIQELIEFDQKMAKYEYELQEWKNKVAQSCELRNLQVCSTASDNCLTT
ncbi:semaphorin-1A-like [Patiria miniata]|uniref:Sema domain-containing protein n=1 Tax=Patiria miniata TaxID=46514 RepID=A0A914BBD8_PATMI|nr:semaphorin-1A-like [Patiria miniata]